MKRALLSVSNKQGLAAFAKTLQTAGYRILSTGGTLHSLLQAGIEAEAISEYTGHPEILNGRVKTLHPRIHGGILARREKPDHLQQMKENEIDPIDVVVVNLYPFEATVSQENVTLEEAIENIDIGGPTLVRAAAKNFQHVTVVTDPADYDTVSQQIQETGGTNASLRATLATRAFAHIADYDAAIDCFLSKTLAKESKLRLTFGPGTELRYGENWHQSATFYREQGRESSVGNAKQLHGKELSFNNIVDADAALESVRELAGTPAVSIIKHTNPCGYATGPTLQEAFEAAWQGDPVSAYGSVIACSQPVNIETAQLLKGRFVEILLAPGFSPEALSFLQSKSKEIRLLQIDSVTAPESRSVYKHVIGGMLQQDRDVDNHEKWECVTQTPFPENKSALGQFAWKACKHTKSNAIVVAREYLPGFFQVVAIGPGQPNRIDSTLKLCMPRVQEFCKKLAKQENAEANSLIPQVFEESVLASDAFFPFDDNIIAANKFGIRYILQPGGAKRDPEVVQTCDRLGVSMIFTGTRHFRH